jgi:hypothetical protein
LQDILVEGRQRDGGGVTVGRPAMYSLRVLYKGEALPRETVKVDRATDVVTRIPELLGRYPDCERVAVLLNGVALFAVGPQGERLED